MTGTALFIKEPFGSVSGEVYFTLYVGEHQNVSHVRLRFLERRGLDYRIQVSALAHNVFAQPTELAFECWITRLPPDRYGG